MSDRVVIVTGAGGAVGRVVARRWLETGARVAAVDLKIEFLDVLESNDDLLKLPGDVMTARGAKAMVERAMDRFGPPDTLIHTVGGFAMAPIESEEAAEQWDRMLAMNATSAFHAWRAMVPVLRARGGGWLVAIASRAALQPTAQMAGYAAGKAALAALTRSLADELRHEDIHVNAILPSTIDTPANRAAMGEGHAPEWVTPDDIADATLFLCSSAARSVHGAMLEVYGKA